MPPTTARSGGSSRSSAIPSADHVRLERRSARSRGAADALGRLRPWSASGRLGQRGRCSRGAPWVRCCRRRRWGRRCRSAQPCRSDRWPPRGRRGRSCRSVRAARSCRSDRVGRYCRLVRPARCCRSAMPEGPTGVVPPVTRCRRRERSGRYWLSQASCRPRTACAAVGRHVGRRAVSPATSPACSSDCALGAATAIDRMAAPKCPTREAPPRCGRYGSTSLPPDPGPTDLP
jgi:hypothetical protein